MKGILGSGIACTLLLLVLVIPATGTLAHTQDNPFVTPLIASGGEPSAFEVGHVTVWNDLGHLYVKYEITLAGWCLNGTNLHVAESLDDIPSNPQGSPRPGQFQYRREQACVPEDTITIPLTWAVGTPLFIAAHAEVLDGTKMTFEIVSNVGDSIYGPILADPFADSDPLNDWTSPLPGGAIEAKNWVGVSPNPLLAGSCGLSQYYNFNWGNGQATDIPGALWISTAANSSDWWEDSWRRVQETFVVPGRPMSASLTTNADNQLWAYVDGVQVINSFAPHDPLSTYKFTPQAGTNALDFVWLNYASGAPGNNEDQCSNPNGVAYRADVEYYDVQQEDVAWGDGSLFPGNRWATYLTYMVQTCLAPPSGLVSWWPADNEATDVIGVHDGLLMSGATYGSGTVGPAFALDGTDDYVSVGNPPGLGVTGDLTVDSWINFSEDPQDGRISSIAGKWGMAVLDDAYMLSTVKQGGFIRLAGSIGDGSLSDTGLVGGVILVGSWTHVAMTYDSQTGENIIYVNGANVGSRIRPGGIYDSDVDFLIGALDSVGGVSQFFPGLIDEVEVFDRTLSDTEIQGIYDAGTDGKCKPALMETIEVLPSGNLLFSSSVLEIGKNYILEVSGTYTYWSTLTPDAGIADAKFSLRPQESFNPGPGPQWMSGDVLPSPWTNYLELLVNGVAVEWGEFSTEHTYAVIIPGTGATVSFSILDDGYRDNSGSLQVDIYRIP